MTRSIALRTTQAQSWADQVDQVSFHSGDPGDDGSNEIGGLARVDMSWDGSAADGTILSDLLTVDLDPDTVLSHIGFWNTGGDYLDSMMANLAFDQATTYNFKVRYTENEELA